jgi:hypothetical protein
VNLEVSGIWYLSGFEKKHLGSPVVAKSSKNVAKDISFYTYYYIKMAPIESILFCKVSQRTGIGSCFSF